MLAFRVTGTDGGDAKNRLGMPLEGRNKEVVSVKGYSARSKRAPQDGNQLRVPLLPTDAQGVARRQNEEVFGGRPARRR